MKKMSIEEFRKKVFTKYNNDIEVLDDEYKNNKFPIKVRCNVCKTERYVAPNKLLTDSKCPKCSNKKKRTQEEFKEEVSSLTNGEYSVIGEYKSINKKVLIRHNKCNNEWEIVASNFIHRNNRCPKCSHPSKRKTTEIFKEELIKLFGEEYICISEYGKSNRDPINIQHTLCGHIFNKAPNDISLNKPLVCPICRDKRSLGCKIIEDYFISNKINFEKELIFENCKKESYLKFDYYLEDLNLLIEYDGEQHFKSWYNDSESLNATRERDIFKNEWVKNHQISLLRIKYTERKNISKILTNFLFKKGSTTNKRYSILYINENSDYIIESNYYN
jgi:hypothetical protein